jgi:hypothetical protein
MTVSEPFIHSELGVGSERNDRFIGIVILGRIASGIRVVVAKHPLVP